LEITAEGTEKEKLTVVPLPPPQAFGNHCGRNRGGGARIPALAARLKLLEITAEGTYQRSYDFSPG